MGAFSGKSGSQSKSSSGGSSKKSSTQSKLNAALKASGGKWTKEVNDLARQRDREKGQTYNASTKTYSSTGGGSGGGLKSIGNALKNAPKNIVRDVGMGVGLTKRDADYYRRTANTIARTQGKAAADRYISQMTQKGGLAAAGVKNADVSGSVNYGQRIGMLNRDGSVNRDYMGSDDGGSGSITPNPEDVQSPAEQTQVNQAMLNRMRMMQGQDSRARNMDMARMMFERRNMMSPGPMPRQMQGIGGFRIQPLPGMNERMMRQGPRQYGGQAQQVSQADFGGIRQRPVPSDDMPRGGFGSSSRPASQQEMMQKMQGMRGGARPAVMPPGFGGQGVQPAVMPPQFPENRMPGYGGQGVMRPHVMPPDFATRGGSMPGIPPIRMPRYPQPMPRNQASSPAFRYAAQNYNRLGGMQRTMPRPMEMMSRGERQQIGRIADSFQPQPMQNPYVGILQRGISAKGGGRTMPQRPPMSGKGRGRTGSQVPSALFGSSMAGRFF